MGKKVANLKERMNIILAESNETTAYPNSMDKDTEWGTSNSIGHYRNIHLHFPISLKAFMVYLSNTILLKQDKSLIS